MKIIRYNMPAILASVPRAPDAPVSAPAACHASIQLAYKIATGHTLSHYVPHTPVFERLHQQGHTRLLEACFVAVGFTEFGPTRPNARHIVAADPVLCAMYPLLNGVAA